MIAMWNNQNLKRFSDVEVIRRSQQKEKKKGKKKNIVVIW